MQVDIMIWFQGLFENFTEFFDVFFMLVTAFGEELILFIILPIFYWAVNKKASHLVALAGFASLTLNGVIKDIAKVERPIGNPNIRFVEIENFLVDTVHLKEGSYSFPSGHTQNIMSSAGTTARFAHKLPVRLICLTLITLVAFSRMYLGVHTLADVLVSLAIGTFLVFILYPVFEKSDEKPYPAYVVMGAMCLMAIIFTFFVSLYKWPEDTEIHNLQAAIKAGYMTSGSSLATLLAFHVDRKYVKSETKAVWWLQIIKIVIGLAIVLAIKEGLKPLCTLLFGNHMISSAIRYFLIVFFAAVIWPWIITYVSKKISIKNKGDK